ncbi:MAG: entericidin A/B family lipoprotein [Alphaproteobacteria bacterium]|nr:entericidin A/B family lipoprotein [Alphaproteobacteria bacterium]
MFRTLVRVVLVMMFTATTGIFLAACNTIEGLGKDIEAGGKATSGAARDVKKKL